MNAGKIIPLDHGAIGNGRVSALVAPTTHIDWMCMPRFDSLSVFARLLDVDKGGTFAILPAEGVATTRMEYVVNTNVLRTEVTCADGRFDVFDNAPRIPAGLDADAPIEIHRLLVPREGAPRGACTVRSETRLRARFGRESLAEQWEAWADGYREVILDQAYNRELGFFVQTLDGRFPDASNLLLATLGLIDPRDPRFVSTVESYERLLVDNGLMLRYRHKDEFGDTTSAFSICSFWWAEALAMIGRLEEAAKLFYRLMGYADNVGLFSEDIDPTTGRLLGNFPQAYTHVGPIHTAVTLSELIEARDARFRAWG